jgi:hypothetical protein
VLCLGHRRVADARRHATGHGNVLALLLIVCLLITPRLSRAQCEWDRFPEPVGNADVIEVHRHGGYGPPPFAGRALASVDASSRTALLRVGQCPDQTLVGRMESPTFEGLVGELGRALASVRRQPPRPIVSDLQSAIEIIREGRVEPFCQAPVDGWDVDVTLYFHGRKEHYACVTGALLLFGERVLKLISDAM